MDRGADLVADLRSGAEPTAGGEIDRRPRSLLAAKRWITVASACCQVDAEGWDSPFPPRRLPRLCLGAAKAIPAKRREDVESKQESGGPSLDWGRRRSHAPTGCGGDVEERRRVGVSGGSRAPRGATRPGSPYRIGDRRTLRLRRSRTSCRAGANQSLEPSRSWRPLATMRATTATARCWQVPSEVGHLPPETKTSEGPNHVGATGGLRGDSLETRDHPQVPGAEAWSTPFGRQSVPASTEGSGGGLTRRWRSLRGGLRRSER
jgi:hypothetical protein